ncbi:CCA tRNA nucleotidyltransferase [Halospeciosus flavus]|uniref:CCA-adding enzyme n=1 Tax=Halospeciosus flavus TaxID=3032283 RepID=A0ABD5Z5G0_9EURY|nr:CCA tRNA nucleotidyltransferase [Halospeciosus flavus]
MSDEELAAVLDAVGERVDPTPDERERLADAVERLKDRARDALDEVAPDVDADLVQVGSTARGTWISGDRDIDLFVRFPADLSRSELERIGLAVGNETLPEGHEEYAEHPYVVGTFEGYDVDLVPCFDVEAATEIRTAVDRTPFHNAYLQERLTDDLAADVRLLKQFLKGIGAYGSNLKTRGFSGYLTELLVVEYGGFVPVLETAADEWLPPVKLDPEDHAAETFDDPLVVIDPTDPERNVAAVVSAENVARLQHYARDLLDDPDEDRFYPDLVEPLSPADVRVHLDRRGTTPLAVRFGAPDLVEDQLYPQLRRSLDGLERGLENAGFDVLRTATFADGDAVLFCELAVAELPAVQRHDGPPVHVRQHAEGFYDKYEEADAYGPFLDGERYVVERDREVRTAEQFAREKLDSVALGQHVASIVDAGDYDVLVDDEVADLANDFGQALATYFDPEP